MNIIHHGYGHDALGLEPPPSWGKPVLQKTMDELWDGIQYMWSHPGYGSLSLNINDHEKICKECCRRYRGAAYQKYCRGCRETVRDRQNRANARDWHERNRKKK